MPADHRFRLDQQLGPEGHWEPARQGGEDESVDLPQVDNLHLAFEDADLVVQHQQLGLISGAVAEACEGEVDEESEAARSSGSSKPTPRPRCPSIVRPTEDWFELSSRSMSANRYISSSVTSLTNSTGAPANWCMPPAPFRSVARLRQRGLGPFGPSARCSARTAVDRAGRPFAAPATGQRSSSGRRSARCTRSWRTRCDPIRRG